MSVIKEGVYTVPSRVLGVFKYLKSTKKFKDKRDNIYNLLSPTELIRKDEDKDVKRNMLQTVILESKKMGLLVEEDDEINIHPDLTDIDEKSLPSAISSLFFSPINDENYDFGRLCSWYLAQDFRDAPSNWEEAEQKLREQIGADLLGLNDARYEQFEYWSCYLGFSWQHAKKTSDKSRQVTVPDPTVYLKRNLEILFKDSSKKELSIKDFMNRLAKLAPVFEFGVFRDEIEQQLVGIVRPPNFLSPVTSMALFRLQEEGFVRLIKESDANVLVFPDGDKEERISHIILLEKRL
jgi:hypothetical protein